MHILRVADDWAIIPKEEFQPKYNFLSLKNIYLYVRLFFFKENNQMKIALRN